MIKKSKYITLMIVGFVFLLPFLFYNKGYIKNWLNDDPQKKSTLEFKSNHSPDQIISDGFWQAEDLNKEKDFTKNTQLKYGAELIAHTAKYFGPKGTISQITNGLNCQSCHLQAGTVAFGNNFGSVASTYPKFRARSGTIENIHKRINDCFERSLNGKALDTTSKEMNALVAYIEYIGSNVKKGQKAIGSGLKNLPFLNRAADSVKGAIVYTTKCQTCHQSKGEGLFNADKTEYTYPPLWGKNSFNDGAGLFRLSNFAKFVKYNMPQGATHLNALLTNEEAWDVAAFVLSQKHPHLNVPKDWPNKKLKPMDYPYSPYADSFTEKQHKYGPFKPILEAQRTAPK
jgi:thiosulfate dehydrogenase